MPFYNNEPRGLGDVEDDARRVYLNAVRCYDSHETAAAALLMSDVVKRLHAHYGRPSSLLGNATHARDSIFFACVDLLGRALRKTWCLKEAQLAFSLGVKLALLCPGAHLWAHEYYSRWSSLIGRREMRSVESSRSGFFGLFGGKTRVVWANLPGETPPDEESLRGIRTSLEALGAVEPYEDELLMELHEHATQDSSLDFEELSRKVHAWGWKDEPFALAASDDDR